MADALLYLSKEGSETVEQIDSLDYFCLGGKGENSIPRISLYLVATAMGMDTFSIQLSKKNSFVREGSVDHRSKSLLTALFVEDKIKEGEDLADISNLSSIFAHADEYANGGMKLLSGYVEDKDDDILMREWIKDFDERYREWFPENPE